MGASVIIAAAGSASRMGGTDKILCKICGREAIAYSLKAFSEAKCTDKIIVVTASEKIEAIKKLVSELNLNCPVEICEGGAQRQDSVMRGLELCDESSDCVMIHDAARPMIESKKIDFLYEKIINEGLKAAALGVAVKDTIKIVADGGKIVSTPKRETLYITQTPQGFDMTLYKSAMQKAKKDNKLYTDDCQLVEALSVPVYMVEGDYKNIKITTPEDLITAENFLKEKQI